MRYIISFGNPYLSNNKVLSHVQIQTLFNLQQIFNLHILYNWGEGGRLQGIMNYHVKINWGIIGNTKLTTLYQIYHSFPPKFLINIFRIINKYYKRYI